MGGSCSVRFEEKDISCRIEDGVVQWHHTSFQGPKNVILVVLGGRLLLFRSTKDYERRRACQQVNLQNYMINEVLSRPQFRIDLALIEMKWRSIFNISIYKYSNRFVFIFRILSWQTLAFERVDSLSNF